MSVAIEQRHLISSTRVPFGARADNLRAFNRLHGSECNIDSCGATEGGGQRQRVPHRIDTQLEALARAKEPHEDERERRHAQSEAPCARCARDRGIGSSKHCKSHDREEPADKSNTKSDKGG